jgi:hypothetical protein
MLAKIVEQVGGREHRLEEVIQAKVLVGAVLAVVGVGVRHDVVRRAAPERQC